MVNAAATLTHDYGPTVPCAAHTPAKAGPSRCPPQPAPTAPVLRLRGIDLHLGHGGRAVHALRAVDLSLHAGERVALIGANGSGKSTLLRVAHGLLAPSAGQVWRAPGLRWAMLFQRPYVLRLSVRANVVLAAWLAGLRGAAAQRAAQAALAAVELAELGARGARALSGGQQQRLALARALVSAPQGLLLDEPTASLDPHAKREVEALMQRYASGALTLARAAPTASAPAAPDPPAAPSPAALPPTLLWASHNLGQVKRLAQRVIYLEAGAVCADLPVADFFNAERLAAQHPQAHAFVKGELG